MCEGEKVSFYSTTGNAIDSILSHLNRALYLAKEWDGYKNEREKEALINSLVRAIQCSNNQKH